MQSTFPVLGIIAVSLGVIAILSDIWTTYIWALGGAALVWIGVRRIYLPARIFGIVLQLAAAWIFVDRVYYPFAATSFTNSYYLGCLLLSVAALFSSWYLGQNKNSISGWERFTIIPLLIWGICWWYLGGMREADHHFISLKDHDVFLLYSSGSTMLMTIVAGRLGWHQLRVAQLMLLPGMIGAFGAGLVGISEDSHLFAGYGSIAWAIALFTQYRLLHQLDSVWPRKWAGYWHVVTLWLVILLTFHEMSWLAGTLFE